MLRLQGEFRNVFRKGRRYPGRSMVLFVLQGENGVRVGFRASRTVGNSVKRNRAKRLLREMVRLNMSRFKNNIDMVYLARKQLLSNTHAQNEKELLLLLIKAHCITADTSGS